MSNSVPRWRNPKVPWYMSEKLSIYDVPQLGTWVGRVGHVIDIASTPCDTSDPQILFLATWYELPRLVISLTKPDSLDLVSSRWGGQHKRRRKKKFTMLEAIAPNEPIPKGVGWAAFSLKEWAERIGWYMLVVDATTQFAVHWTSTVYQWNGCNVPNEARARSTAVPGIYGPFDAGTYTFSGWEVQEQHTFSADADSIDTPTGFDSAIGFSLVTKPISLPVQEASVTSFQLVDTIGNRVLAYDNRHDGYEGKTYGQIVYRDWGVGLAAHHYTIRYTKTEGFFELQHGNFSCHGGKSLGMSADP